MSSPNPPLESKTDSPETPHNTDEAGTSKSGLSLKQLPSWAVSLVIHAVFLLVLYNMTYTPFLEAELTPFTSTTVFDDWEPEELKVEDFEITDVGNDSSLQNDGGSEVAALIPAEDTHEEVERSLEEAVAIEIDVPVFEQIASMPEAELVAAVEVKGTSEVAGGVNGAIDRLTVEIASSLRQQKTMVIWLLDASLSLEKRRNQIADRIKNVYDELGVMKLGAEGTLTTGVVSFGEKTRYLTPTPVDTPDEAISAIRSVAPDQSGEEKVFSAIGEVCQKWSKFRTKQKRNMMVVVVTDERGDDGERVDELAYELSRRDIRIYCVGNAAVFGRLKGYQPWTLDNGEVHYLPVDQGPETLYPERIRLPFWGRNSGQYDIFSAGVGPYALTRLCAETGGMFLITDQPEGPIFNPEVMRNYLPDYRSTTDYRKAVAANKAVSSLVRAAQNSSGREQPDPRIVFRADELDTLKQQIDDAQEPFADFVYHLENEILSILKEGETDRDRVASARWQAGYDLAFGRALAVWVRTFGYNKMLAQMKVAPLKFSDPKNNMWRLMPTSQSDAGSKVKKYHEMAQFYLNRVIEEHPGTPWAMLAAKELETPVGWRWQDGFNPRFRPAPTQQQPTPQLLLEEERRMQRRRRTPTPEVKLPRL